MQEGFVLGEWEVRPDEGTLNLGEEQIQLEPKVMEVLVCLAKHAGEVLHKERLIQEVWPDAFVTDDVLTHAVSALRKALNDDSRNSRYIQTLPRRGYRLIAKVEFSREPEGDGARYTLLRKLGEGGMGEVYLGEDKQLKRRVALKFLHPSKEGEEVARRRLKREARAAAALDHPYICKVYETGKLEQRDFIAMEYIEGGKLSQRLQSGPLARGEALRIAVEMAEALEAAHRLGIIHRDVKPSNVMLTDQGHIKITDFGIAKKIWADRSEEGDWTQTQTGGQASATPAYTSPEQLRGATADQRTDIFLFGIVFYEMLTGVHPFRRPTQAETTAAILDHDPPLLNRYLEGAPKLFQTTIRKMLAKDPTRRYQSIQEVRADLEQLIEDSKNAGIRRNGAIPLLHEHFWLAAIGCCVVAGTLAFLAWIRRDESGPPAERKVEHRVYLADFDTGDAAFDRLLEDTVRNEFADSASLGMIAESGEKSILAGMVRPLDSRFTVDVAREACERVGQAGLVKGVVSGSVLPVGDSFEIVLRADNCRGGQLAIEQGRATGRDDVVPILAETAASLVTRLERLLPTVEGPEGLFGSARRTPSIDALRLYSESWESIKAGKTREAVSFLERAIEYDTDFAAAHLSLAVLYHARGQLTLAREHAVRAWECREREEGNHERYAIEYEYDSRVSFDLEEAIQTARMTVERNPDSWACWQRLAYSLSQMGQLEEGLEAFQESARKSSLGSPAEVFPGYLLLDRRPEAKADLEKLLSQQHFSIDCHRLLWQVALLNADRGALQREADWIETHPDEDGMYELRMHEAFFQGRFREGRDLLDDWVLVLGQQGREELAEQVLREHAWVEAAVGNESLSRKYLVPLIDAHTAHLDLIVRTAYTMALLGEAQWVERALETAVALYPKATLLHNLHVPTLRAILESKRGELESPLRRLRTVRRYEQAPEADKFKLIRGQILLASGRADEAVEAFRKVLDHPGQIVIVATWRLFGPVFSWIEIPVARVGLARALAAGGDAAAAREAYEDFFEFWEGADPEIPLLRQARAEYAQLR